VNDSVDFVRGYTGAKGLAGNVENLPADTTRVPKSCLSAKLLFGVDPYVVVVLLVPLLAFRHTGVVVGVVGSTDVRRNRPSGTIKCRTKGAGEAVVPCPAGKG
jgi:hypothetical protein